MSTNYINVAPFRNNKESTDFYVEQQLKYDQERKLKLDKSETRTSLKSESASVDSNSSSTPFVIGADDDAQQIYDPNYAINKRLKKTWLDWCEVSTTHALSNLARARNKVVFFLWLATFLACVAYCSYTIINILVSFLSYQVLVNLQVVHATPIDFPAVTICNINPFDRRKAGGFINDTLISQHLEYVAIESKINITSLTVLDLAKSALLANKSLTTKDIQYYGFDLNFMLLSCWFNGVQCNESDFVLIYDFDYTNCYTFNSGRDKNGNKVPIKKISESGSDNALSVGLFLGEEKAQGDYMTNSGAHVAIHNQSVKPIINEEGRDMATNYQSNIGIKRSFVEKLGPPYSTCLEDNESPFSFDSDYYRAIFNILNMTTYRQQSCRKLCLQKYINDTCGCIDGGLPNIYGDAVRVCSKLNELNCVTQKQMEYYSKSTSLSCPECPLECNKVLYELSFSSSRYPTKYYTDYLKFKSNILTKFSNTSIIDEYAITKNIVLLNVFYDTLATTYVSETPQITTDTLLGNIGGNLGLFVGMSALSFVEIIEIVIQLLIVRSEEKKKCLKKIENNLRSQMNRQPDEKGKY